MTELSDLLKMEFTHFEDEREVQNLLCEISSNVLRLHNQGKQEIRDFELLRLQMFAKHLRTAREADPMLFEHFLDELHQVEYGRYLGVRFEIDISASLISKDIEFSHPDPPDFVLDYDDQEIVIECTTSHLQEGDRDPRDKVSAAITEKAGKDYASPSMAVFIDYTNILYHGIGDEETINESIQKNWIEADFDIFDMDLGSVLLFAYVGDDGGFRHTYRRIDNGDEVDPALESFLYRYYSHGDEKVEEPYRPSGA